MKAHSTNAAHAANKKASGFQLIEVLLYGIACIQSLPKEQQEREKMLEMCKIARLRDTPTLALTLWGIETLIGREIDLWPAGGGFRFDGAYSDEELDQEAAVRAEIKQRKERFEETGALIDAPPSDVIRFF
ncbi:hypothetical protein [Rhodobacter capsulatus]|jgi:hypothetical protein|uniref:Conserved domain protein n=1 Tax=Rhodobacter capsulatus (strain ATCC BAA-309 / NBRC 16581 / SB1003) TaxID=272942 RepID=D5ALL5_RHOCB|nr:hypothetical protein [Rhodobacter capsulatus]ADE86076.1 conserved domain protein [Rhodobacter capsulatus SB 1003]ETD01321.1 hypothetical protein U714_13050 [Rhodobacter capsulatus DE442]ETD75901.1 hypothetical protein U717_13215 [Rhodobacter capsulatus R121]ETE53171.1 hypothetical protein U715_13215 [Rhodobacter capsulatus Y262]MDS0927888.1 hypothetical protein [Rhodobacter capsulatus]